MAESLSQYIEQLSALPPRERMEAFRAIPDPAVRRRVARELPPQVFSEILGESMLENLNLKRKLTREECGRLLPGLQRRLYDLEKACWDQKVSSLVVFEGWEAAKPEGGVMSA